jgi:hypothetical protein
MTATPSVFAQRISQRPKHLEGAGPGGLPGAVQRPAPVGIPAGTLAGREWLSGFTGSMGTLVVTRDRAALFADSRYWTQAETELAHTGIELVKIDTGASTHHVQWLAQNTGNGQVVGV